MDDTEYITLKEAALISGYAPDYIGQLIRRGKIPGKQVYANVAWVTTKEAIRAYQEGKIATETASLSQSQTEDVASPLPSAHASPQHILRFLDRIIEKPELIERLHRAVSLATIVLASLFLALLFAIFSIALHERSEARALEQAASGIAFHSV